MMDGHNRADGINICFLLVVSCCLLPGVGVELVGGSARSYVDTPTSIQT